MASELFSLVQDGGVFIEDVIDVEAGRKGIYIGIEAFKRFGFSGTSNIPPFIRRYLRVNGEVVTVYLLTNKGTGIGKTVIRQGELATIAAVDDITVHAVLDAADEVRMLLVGINGADNDTGDEKNEGNKHRKTFFLYRMKPLYVAEKNRARSNFRQKSIKKIGSGKFIGQLPCIIERIFEKERENMEEAERENIILWIVDQVRQMPLGLLKQVRGFIRGITKP